MGLLHRTGKLPSYGNLCLYHHLPFHWSVVDTCCAVSIGDAGECESIGIGSRGIYQLCGVVATVAHTILPLVDLIGFHGIDIHRLIDATLECERRLRLIAQGVGSHELPPVVAAPSLHHHEQVECCRTLFIQGNIITV